MNTHIVISQDGFACGFCNVVGDASNFTAASRLIDEHLRDTHGLRWANVAPYRLQQIADGKPFVEIVRKSI
jgi:hypothetical protein